MENASKALIIAGAILLAIVLVSLGVLVINNARGDIEKGNLDETSIYTFNSKFTPYLGNNKSGTDVNNLMEAIVASNGAQKNAAEKHYISISVGKNIVVAQIDSTATVGFSYGLDKDGNNATFKTSDVDENNNPIYTKWKSGYPTFNNSTKYKVTADYDEGYIYKVVVLTN